MPETLLDVAIDRGDLPIPALAASERWQSLGLALEIPPTVSLGGTLQREAPTGNVNWVTLDWGNLRQIVGISVTLTGASSGLCVGMKVSAGGVWFVPVPPGKLDATSRLPVCQGTLSFVGLTGTWTFPPVVASALYLELISNSGAAQAANVVSVQVTALNEAVDLSLSFGTENRKWLGKKSGKLEDIDLLALGQPDVKLLKLRAAGGVQVRATLSSRKLTASTPASTVPAAAQFDWPAPGASTSSARWEVPATGTLLGVRATLTRELAKEVLTVAPTSAPTLARCQLLDPQHTVTQPLAPCTAGMAGVDVWVAAPTRSAAGTLRLCADLAGRPGTTLFSAPWSLTKGAAGWCSLPVGQALPEGTWLVVESSDEAFLSLDKTVSLPACWHRTRSGPWLPAPAPASVRVRGIAPPPTTLTAVVSRGAKKVEVSVLQQLEVDAAGLAQLNQASGAVTIEVRSPVAGSVELRDLQVLLG